MVNAREYTVLLAEDNAKLRARFFNILRREGFRVLRARNGNELYRKAKNYEGDLSKLVIVSDTDMPHLCGDEACSRLLEDERFRRVIIIGMSDNSNNEEYWKGVCLLQTFIYKGAFIDVEDFDANIASLVKNRLETILGNPAFYLLKDRSYRRSAV